MGNCCKKKNVVDKNDKDIDDESNENSQKSTEKNLLEVKDNQSNNSGVVAETNFINDNDAIKIGLENIGATCYMNATLQCLSNTKSINNFFQRNMYTIKTLKIKGFQMNFLLL